jgi:inorganic phosphate transporter, PiT family
MLELTTVVIIAVVFAALAFDFTNGWNDAANSIATVVATRVLTPFQAVALAAVLNVAGAFATTAVAKTIGKGIVDPAMVTQMTVLGALIGATAWNVSMTMIGLPISASHSLIGGLIGGALASAGVAALKMSGLKLIFLAMLISPLIGAGIGWLLIKVLYYFFAGSRPHRINEFFKKAQLASVAFMSFSHGSADAQKAMGIITLALFTGGFISDIKVPVWVILSCALVMGIGTMVGGWGVIKTLGMKMLELRPIQGFAAETGAACFLMTAATMGLPVSTTHTITGSIVGVGVAAKGRNVRWGVANKILYAWLLTLPGAGLVAYLSTWLLEQWIKL